MLATFALLVWLMSISITLVLLCARIRGLERVVWATSRQQNYLIYKLIDSLKPATAVGVNFHIMVDGVKRKVTKMFLKDSQNLPVFVSFADAKGNAATVDGAPVWAVSDESLATVEVAEGGMSALVKPVGPLGTFTLQVKADADLGEGIKEIMGEMSIEVIGGEAVAVSIGAGTPVDA